MSVQQVPTTYPEMFKFNAAVMGFGQNQWMNEVLAVFHNIVTNVSNSARLQEECDVLGLRIARVVSKKQINLGEYKSCMLASLRSLLPKDWDSIHEVSWTWLWDNVERLVMRLQGLPQQWEPALGKILASLDEETKFEIRKDIYNKFFTLAPVGQDFFKQSNTYLHIVADKILAMTLELYQNPVKMVDDVSALGLRHVGYAIPTELFGPFVTACVEVFMTRTSDETTIEAIRWSLGLISKMLVRTITEGSTIVMKAINANSQKLMKKAISCAPRGERAQWMLLIQVGTQNISPLAWSIESGNTEAAAGIIKDLLTFRADRDRYYYGEEELFKRHHNIIQMLCDNAPALVPTLLDGLIWRSRLTENGMRRVNYYIKHLLVGEDGNFAKTLLWVTSTKDPKLVCHPICVLMADLVWSKVAFRSFLYSKSWFLLTVLVFILSQSILEHSAHTRPVRIAIFACRCFIYGLSMAQLLWRHGSDSFRAFRAKDTKKIFGCIQCPTYLFIWQNTASFLLTVSLVAMVSLEPILWCWQYQHGKLFNEDCPERSGLKFPYATVGALATFFYFVLLIDLSIVSTRISAYTLVCVRMLSEVALFIGALAATILAFASSASVLKQDNPQFAGIHKASYAFLRMALSAYDADKYMALHTDPALEVMVFVYVITSVFFFLSMLVAQLSCAYSAVYDDMVGYARLERAETICAISKVVPKLRWNRFVDSLRLNKRLEFNPGDIGVAGGIQMREAANLHPTTQDMIKRFGGSTSPDAQWPADDDDEGDDKFEKLEKLIQRTMQRVTQKGGRGHGGSAGGTGTGTGTGTGSGSGDHSSGGGDEDE